MLEQNPNVGQTKVVSSFLLCVAIIIFIFFLVFINISNPHSQLSFFYFLFVG